MATGGDTSLLFLILEHCCQRRYSLATEAVAMELNNRGLLLPNTSPISLRLALFQLESLMKVPPSLDTVSALREVLAVVKDNVETSLPHLLPTATNLEAMVLRQYVLAPLYAQDLPWLPTDSVDLHLARLEEYFPLPPGASMEHRAARSALCAVADLVADVDGWQDALASEPVTEQQISLQAKLHGVLKTLRRRHSWQLLVANISSLCGEVEGTLLPPTSQLEALTAADAGTAADSIALSKAPHDHARQPWRKLSPSSPSQEPCAAAARPAPTRAPAEAEPEAEPPVLLEPQSPAPAAAGAGAGLPAKSQSQDVVVNLSALQQEYGFALVAHGAPATTPAGVAAPSSTPTDTPGKGKHARDGTTPPSHRKKLRLNAPKPSAVQIKFSESNGSVPSAVDTPKRPAPRAAGGAGGKKTTRRRRKFSAEEVAALKAGVGRWGIGNWAKVLASRPAVFKGRTAVDLKDKWRNLNKK